MKKLFKLFIVLLFSFPLFVMADCSTPLYNDGLYGTIINKNGVKIYDETIPYGTVVEINSIYEGEYWFNYNGESEYYTEIKNIELNNAEEYANKLSKEIVKQEKETYYTLSETVLRKGPADSYDKVGKIPANVDINVYYSNKVSSGEWVYVEYNGTYGWVLDFFCGNFESVTIAKKTDTILAFYGEKLKVTKGSFDGKEVELDVPVGTKFNDVLSVGYSGSYCFKYNNEYYCAHTGLEKYNYSPLFVQTNKEIEFYIDMVKLYSLPIFEDKYLTNVKLENSKNVVKYEYWEPNSNNSYFGIEIDGKIYWTIGSEDDLETGDFISYANLDDDTDTKTSSETTTTETIKTPKMTTRNILIIVLVYTLVIALIIILLNSSKKSRNTN